MNGPRGADVEVAVAGSGPVGAACAALLGRERVQCLLVGAPRTAAGADHDPRALAVTPASQRILSAAGAWSRLPADRIGRFSRIHVWDENSRGEIEFDAADICEPVLGWIVEQGALEGALDEVVNFHPTVSLIPDGVAAAVDWEQDRVLLTLEDGRQLSVGLLIAADGARSRLRELAGIAYPVHDYEQQAVACTVETGRPHEQVARQRFLGGGPLAFLPLADAHRSAVVWSTTPRHAAELLEMDAGNFNSALAAAIGHRLGDIRDSGPRKGFPLARAQAQRYCRERFALIGDAAHSIHPLAGLGANLGWLDAASLCQELLRARTRGRDPGSRRVLRSYERWRRGENLAVMMVLEGFKYLFENQGQPLPAMRELGLSVCNASGLLKRLVMRRAMGLEGDLPLIARGHA